MSNTSLIPFLKYTNFVCLLLISISCQPNGDDDKGPSADELPAEFESLIGRYAQLNVVKYIDPETEMNSLIVTYGFAEIFEEEGQLYLDESYCHSDHISDMLAISTVPDEFTQSIMPTTARLIAENNDGVITINRPPTPTAVGIQLDDSSESLPTNPQDPRIWDQDGDGNPGVTVYVDVPLGENGLHGEIYIIRREIFEYNLTLEEDGSLSGTITDSSEQLVIGASDEIFMIGSNWYQDSDLNASPLYFVPIDAHYDCSLLMDNAEELLPKVPTL